MKEDSVFTEYYEKEQEEIKPIAHCDICGEPLYEGDGITDIFGDKWCDDCLKDNRKIL